MTEKRIIYYIKYNVKDEGSSSLEVEIENILNDHPDVEYYRTFEAI